jgi:hypothetical protein
MRSILVATVLLIASRPVHAAEPITACGTTIPRGQTGVLSGDLACNGTPAVMLKGSRLDLAGHTITSSGVPAAVQCDWPGCTVLGNGGSIVAVTASRGILVTGGKLRVDDITIDGGAAVEGNTRIYATSARLIGRATYAMLALRIRAIDVDVSDSEAGLLAINRLSGERITANATRNHGVAGGRVRVKNLVAHGNANGGVAGRRVALSESTVTGNGIGPSGGGVDVWAEVRPRLIATTCDKSADGTLYPAVVPWGVCAND